MHGFRTWCFRLAGSSREALNVQTTALAIHTELSATISRDIRPPFPPTMPARAMPATQESFTTTPHKKSNAGVIPVLYHSSINFNTNDKM